MYTIKKAPSRAFFMDHTNVFETGAVSFYPWGGDYRPETVFQLGYAQAAIYVRLSCVEAHPLRRAAERNGPVWLDSCIEFFFEPLPGRGYFNFEMNSFPTLLCHYNPPDGRHIVVDWPLEAFGLTAREDAKHWELSLTVPVDMVAKYVPGFALNPGMTIRANVYKCGDKTAQPHFGCFHPIDAAAVPTPQFHVPQYFGSMRLE